MKRLIVVGILVFLAVLVANFPARLAYRWFAPPDVTLTGIGGSVWHGAAAEALVGDAYLTDVEWHFKPAALMSGNLAFATRAKPAAGTLTADVQVSPGGVVTVSALSGGLPLGILHPAFQQEGISGDLRFDVSRLVLRHGIPAEVVGVVRLSNVGASALSAAPLGDYRLDIRTADAGIVGQIDDIAGVLDVDGELVLRPDRSFLLTGNVMARPGAPPSVTSQLQYLGSPDEKGMRQFRFEGSL